MNEAKAGLPFNHISLTIEKAELNATNRYLHVTFPGGKVLQYPYVWLRDNCQCAECFHKASVSRLPFIVTLDTDIEPNDVQVTDNNMVRILWHDGHMTVFESDWLFARRFTRDGQVERMKFLQRIPQCWGSELQVLKISFQEVLSESEAMYNLLDKLETIGLCVVTGIPSEGACAEIASAISFLRPTVYGTSIFTVKARAEETNLAHTTKTLDLHTDLPHHYHTPGVQMLHCIKQAGKGGENIFADGFHAAKILVKNHPEYYKLLTTQALDFYLVGTGMFEHHFLTHVPVIQLNSDGEPIKINYSNTLRDSFLCMPLEKVNEFYNALRKFGEIMTSKENLLELKMNAGEMVIFNNCRILHGRNGYLLDANTERYLEGGYLDWDEVRSKRRVLEKKLGKREYIP